MANEIRSRTNLVSGTLSVALAPGDTTMSSAGLANLAAITSANHAVIVIENEIIYVTAHTASATTATILRAQEGTSAASHAQNVAWVHGPVVSDYDSVLGRATVTANQASITSAATDLTGLSVTVTVPYAQHLIRITGYTRLVPQTSVTDIQLQINEGATLLNWAEANAPLAGNGWTLRAEALVVPTAASHTYKLTVVFGSGTTNSLAASATNPAFILVEDLGPSL